MAASFSETHKQVQFYWQEGCRIAKEKKDYGTALELINDALKLVMKSKVFDDNYKNSRRYQFCRQLTLLALKSEMPEDALKYAQLCNRPDYIADAYFQNGQFEQCLTYYMALAKPYTVYPGWTWSPSDKLSRQSLPKVAKAFYHLSQKYPEKYTIDSLREDFGWLYGQIIARFGSLENAFSYYQSSSNLTTTQNERKTDSTKAKSKIDKKQIHEVMERHRNFSKEYFERIDHLSNLLNQRDVKLAKSQLMKLHDDYQSIEVETQSKVIGNTITVADGNLVIDIAEILLLNQEVEEALSWCYDHLNNHWRHVDYYLNLKFLLNRDISGADLVRIGFSSQFRNNVGIVVFKNFYRPSMFAERNVETMTSRCEVQLSDYKRNLGNNYLRYLASKYVNKDLPLGRYGANDALYRHTHALFGGEYGKYSLNQEITPQDSIEKVNLNLDALYGSEGKWIHIAFSSCPELVKLISDFCTNCENELRRERGISAIGEQWKSETEIYAFVREILPSYEVIRHCSPVWLTPMHLDVYVPNLNFAVEYQGQQHYKPIDVFGGKDGFERTRVRDTIKRELCSQNQLHLLEIRHDDGDPEKTIVDFIEKKLKVRIV